ncbi:MAG: MBL fold metallo-hydrolase [Acidobacteria bacterium]|nr:MBL fold metallo-hydrolase [Acidobacteriota bacterium]
MQRLTALVVATALLGGAGLSAQQPTAIQRASTLLGAGAVKTLQFTGAGQVFSVGQNYTSSDPWPAVPVKNYTAAMNFDTGSMRVELLRTMGPVMPRGGGAPFTGEQRQIQVVSGNYAWNVAAAPAGGAAPAAQPQPGAQSERMLALWATPQGFVKAAMANNATTRGSDVTFTVGGKYRMVGTINGKGEVEKVQTWIDQSIVGDMLVETTYSGYKDFGGVTFPSRIVQKQDGFPSLDLTIASVTANPAVDVTVPDNVRNAPPPPAVTVAVEKLGDGAYYLTGGTHHSLAIEMRDHIVVVDVPNSEARASAVLAKAKELIPNKPIRYLVTSHHHWDHLGGIRTAMDEGATIVTHESNKAFLERVARTPHTLGPDRLAASKKAVKIQTVGDKGQLTDGTRTIELYRLQGYEHTTDMLIVYLPKEKILGEPDAFTPPAQAGTPLIPPAVIYAKALYANVQRLKLDVQTITPFHGNRKSDVAELARAAGTTATN